MKNKALKEMLNENPVLNELSKGIETVWINPDLLSFSEAKPSLELNINDINDAEERLLRFAPFIMRSFPETIPNEGIIESPLTDISRMQENCREKYKCDIYGKWLLKQDSHLAISGSVKARGGIYEVLKHAEKIALSNGLISLDDNYALLAEDKNREFFSNYCIQVGSTGNLGMSIGIMGAAMGFKVIVHMSADAKQWKKDLLRSHGVEVIEYESDYSLAVQEGRKKSNEMQNSYFVDDENSRDLFLAYAVAAKRLLPQLNEQNICVDEEHPLFVYIPCGVGGAPGGISFGLKQIFGDNVHCFFVEPTEAPCMLLGMASGLNHEISIQDIGLSGLTDADGLAVGRPSGFVGGIMKTMLSGIFTVKDQHLYDYLSCVWNSEKIFLEPSACAGFIGALSLMNSNATKAYCKEHNLTEKISQSTHIVWATGGNLVPEEIREMSIQNA